MKSCCNTNILPKSAIHTQPSLIKPTPIVTNKITSFQIDSGFCQYCGVDVFLFAHEFWCRLSLTED